MEHEESKQQAKIVEAKFEEIISEQKKEVARDLNDLRIGLDLSEKQANVVQAQLEAIIAKEKQEAAKELSDVNIALKQSQELAKVNLA